MNKIEEQIKQWVVSADKYHYLLESEEEYIAKEITKLCIDFAREAYLTGKGTGWSEALGTEIQTTFEQWLEKKL